MRASIVFYDEFPYYLGAKVALCSTVPYSAADIIPDYRLYSIFS